LGKKLSGSKSATTDKLRREYDNNNDPPSF